MGRLLDGLDLLEVPPLADDFALRVVSQVVPACTDPSARSSWSALGGRRRRRCSCSASCQATGSCAHDGSPVATTLSQRRRSTRRRVAYTGSPASDSVDRAVADNSLWTVMVIPSWNSIPRRLASGIGSRYPKSPTDLRPIATPFNAAVTAIRRTIPVGRPPGKGSAQPRAIPCATGNSTRSARSDSPAVAPLHPAAQSAIPQGPRLALAATIRHRPQQQKTPP